MKTFSDFMEMLGPQTLHMSGYDVVVMQYSNKGPLFIIKMGEEEVARAWFDFSTEKVEFQLKKFLTFSFSVVR